MEKLTSPSETAKHIEEWLRQHGREDSASMLLYEAARALKATAAKGQNRPRGSIVITLRQAEELLASFGGHDCEMVVRALEAGAVKMDEGESESPAGLWAHCAEYPDEGCIYLGPTEVDDDLAARGRQADGNQAEPAKRTRSSAETAESCEGAGCGYLTAGNGEQQAEPRADELTNAIDEVTGALELCEPESQQAFETVKAALRAAQSGQRADSGEPQALRDMLDDARAELDMLRAALGVPAEPHQSLMERMLEATRKAGQRAAVAECVWDYDEDTFTYNTACGNTWSFVDGDAEDNGVKFCQGCGGRVLLAAAPTQTRAAH